MTFKRGKSGNPNGRPKGATNAVQIRLHRMFEDAVNDLSDGDNPLTVIAEVMNDPALMEIINDPLSSNFDIMNALRLRLQAASDLSKHIVPNLPKELNVNVNHFETEISKDEMLLRLEEINKTLLEHKIEILDGVVIEHK